MSLEIGCALEVLVAHGAREAWFGKLLLGATSAGFCKIIWIFMAEVSCNDKKIVFIS